MNEFNGQMKEAVIVVLSLLPNRDADREAVAQKALSKITDNGQAGQDAERIIRRLIKKSPRCFGVSRQSGWWKIVLQFLTAEEAVEAYLIRFPDPLTDQQRQDIVNYLVRVKKFPGEMVAERVKKFGWRRRLGYCSQGPSRSEHGF